jgi:hypothetical protein
MIAHADLSNDRAFGATYEALHALGGPEAGVLAFLAAD